ncbi:hypothetical protein M3C31_00205 [Staphylococcus hominis]|uniref:hypothetical protein n=1 Tax=Staphylococcus hominis TaxID=1290 RepID=UPI0021A8227A|nr:hypothetical protein [Staphylococcus hominis]MCT1482268.1 hypothetical protein [Staphylococcus hominis]
MNIDYSKLTWIKDHAMTTFEGATVKFVSVGLYMLEPYGIFLTIDLDDHEIIRASVVFSEVKGDAIKQRYERSDDMEQTINQILKELGVVYD